MSDEVKEIKKLEKHEYLQWKLSINEVNSFDQKMRIAQLERKLLEKDIQLMQHEIKNKIRIEKDLSELKKLKNDEFQVLRKMLEDKIGISFDKAVIDEVSLEIKELETQGGES